MNNDSGWLFGEVLGVCVGLLSGSDWKRVRQQVEDGFSRPTAARYTADLVTLAREYVHNTLLASSEQSLETKGIIHVEPAKTLQFFPFLAVAQILFGRLSPMQRSQLTTLAPLREELFKEVIRGGINRLSIAPWFRSRGVRLLNEFQTHWQQFVEDAYHKAVERNQSPRPLVIGLWEAYQAGTISKREVSAHLDGSFECSDSYSACKPSTSRSTPIWTSPHMPSRGMSCCWQRIARHRRNCDRKCSLRCEARQASRTNGILTGMTRSWLLASWNRHECAQYCVSKHPCSWESHVLMSLAAFSNPESAPEDLYVDGYLIPANVCKYPSVMSRAPC